MTRSKKGKVSKFRARQIDDGANNGDDRNMDEGDRW